MNSMMSGAASMTSSVREETNEQRSFAFFLRNYAGAERIRATYENTLKDFKDEEKIRSQGDSLHPGFNKLCGLRGCRLSGGQK